MNDSEFSTPMMLQYMQIKQQYADCLLWFRLGDFYEMFLEDAKIGSRILEITLTSRARGKDGRIPMAGIPYHAADSYLSKLIKAGHKVAICEQVTEPDGKGLVERQVVRVVTPGTVLDEKVLTQKENNYVLSLVLVGKMLGVAAADVSTGAFLSTQFSLNAEITLEQVLSQIMTHLSPAECILSPKLYNTPVFLKPLSKYKKVSIFPFESQLWDETKTAETTTFLQKFFHVSSLKSFAISDQITAQSAAAALLHYLQETQKTFVSHIRSIQPLFPSDHLQMSRSTIMNLELFSTLHDGQKHGSFLHTMDATQTAMGGRLLKKWILQPLQKKSEIEARLETVQFFFIHPAQRTQLQALLHEMHDIERILARLSVNLGNPRDLKNLEHSLRLSLEISLMMKSFSASKVPPLLQQLSAKIPAALQKTHELIHNTIVDDPPFDPRRGHLVRTGIHKELDDLRHTVDHSRDWIAQLEMQERQKTGIPSLKIKFNQVFGFYIEVSKANLHLVPETYFRKQTLVNAERFTMPELKQHEEVILTAEEKIAEIEYKIFGDVIQNILADTDLVQQAAHGIAQLDCLLSFADIAEKNRYIRPKISQTGTIRITNGRHPIVEKLVEHHQFVPNNVELNHHTQQLIIITGPNMAGKSVLMRQVALITLMAHMGSFVPAEAAEISLTDQIFVRSGASDMITAGLSTFMVEMVETAYILRHATEKSLIIMDEIGRGTSTYDGISIAWAVAESLAECGPKTLFATHYHELQVLEKECPGKIKNYHMAIAEHHGKPVFLYQLTPGGASHSFGVAVAELAGVSEKVIKRSQTLLHEMETRTEPTEGTTKTHGVQENFLREKLDAISIDHTTPLEALRILADLKNKK